MSKVSNTLTMLRLLESGKKYSVKELAEKLEVSPRMIKSYKEELEKCGINAEYILILFLVDMVVMCITKNIITIYLLII